MYVYTRGEHQLDSGQECSIRPKQNIAISGLYPTVKHPRVSQLRTCPVAVEPGGFRQI